MDDHGILCYNGGRDKSTKKFSEEAGMIIRKATENDISQVAAIYDEIITAEENSGEIRTGWQRGVYPTEQTAVDALTNGTLFVLEDDQGIAAAAKIDQCQVKEYADCSWKYDADDSSVMVLHTLVVSPGRSKRGYGKAMVGFYEKYALERGCGYLRMDTNVLNSPARELYGKLGYDEAGIVSSTFNGIPDVSLVCLEKKL